jgi:DNA-binding CsgD family transcriptional regulator
MFAAPVITLLEREHELARLRAALDDAAAGRGRVLLLEGEAGIGKTALLRAAAGFARERGVDLVEARGGELEQDISHGVARQLFEPRLRQTSPARRRALLDGAAAAAAPILGFAAPDPRTGAALSPEDASFAIQHGLYWLTANLASHTPLAVCVDDAHWADEASVRWLVYLARRLDELPVALVVAVRSGDPAADRACLRALRDAVPESLIEPAALTPHGCGQIVRRELGDAVTDAVVDACRRASGGNPFLLGELARSLDDPAVEPGTIDELSPRSVTRSVIARLERLPAPARALAGAVAVLGADASPNHARALADLDEQAAVAATDALAGAQLLETGVPLRFIHPIVRTAVHDALPPAQRSALHIRAAYLLGDEDRAPERAAVHLLAAHPSGDPWVVDCLSTAAAHAMERGAAEPAHAMVVRALAEPASPSERPRLLTELARAERQWDPDAAGRHLREALAATEDPDVREAAASELAVLLVGSEEGVEVLEAELDRTPEADSARRERLEAALGAFAQVSHAHSAAVAARLADVPDDLPGETPVERVMLAALCCDRLLQCSATGPECAELAERALAGDRLLIEQGADSLPVALAVEVLILTDRFAAVSRALEAAEAYARERNSRAGSLAARLFGARVAYQTGRLPPASADSLETLDGWGDVGIPPVLPMVVGNAVRPLIALGRPHEAEALLVAAGLDATAVPLTTPATDFLLARSELHLDCGRTEASVADALEAVRRRRLSGGVLPPVGWRLTAALALRAAGDDDRARELADEEVSVAEGWGVPGALGSALRVQGLLAGGAEGRALLERSVTILEGCERQLELARALVDWGSALRRGRQAAASREPLRRGLDLAARCGAAPLQARAREELLATGARPRRDAIAGRDALTPSERRVAALAAEGLANPSIAQTLFVTRKTVETHLHAVYRKLDINSRHDLAAALEAEALS